MSRSQLELQSVNFSRKRRETGKWPLISWATTRFLVSPRQSASLPTVWSCPAQLKLLRLAATGL